jgi:hydrogenase maturation protease
MTLREIAARPLLVYGIGNVGRQDDGVGPLLVERLEACGMPTGVTLESGYQLAPEDALLVSRHDTVIFVDATRAKGAPEPYAVVPVQAALSVSFSTHALSMESVLALCAHLYGRAPRAYAVAIPGVSFEVNAPLSPQAAANLEAAVRAVRAALGDRHD